jgi:serine phosphatase RsbU (regulator of sigma subunit)
MITEKVSMESLLVYAQGSDGRRIPMQVTVAPIRNDSGEVIGGVETFRDASAVVHDLERAQKIQKMAMETDIPADIPLAFTTHYFPKDIVGGDYYAIKDLGDSTYGLILADVMGHGLAAALYTMHLSSLWDRYCSLLKNPVEFTSRINKDLAKLVKADTAFATAICGIIDMNNLVFDFVSAGGPEPVLSRADGTQEILKSAGTPLALMEDADYEEISIKVGVGDRLLLFSDGVVEVKNANGNNLGTDGLIKILKKQEYPQVDIQMEALEEELLKYSNAIRLEDDLTLIEICFDK